MKLTKTFKLFLFICLSTTKFNLATSKKNNSVVRGRLTSKLAFDRDEFSTFSPKFNGQNIPFKIAGNGLNISNFRSPNQKQPTRRLDEKVVDLMPREHSIKLDSFWIKTPYDNFTARKDTVKKLDYSFSLPTWSSKKEISHNSRNRKNRKHYLDSLEDYLGMDSKYHDMSDRKYIHEHEGFFFPIHVPPSHHEKDDHLIPLLLLLLLPLLLFAIIIPLNANLLSTLFLIMQNNGATTTAAQLAAASGRRRRYVYQTSDPFLENRIMEALVKIGTLADNF